MVDSLYTNCLSVLLIFCFLTFFCIFFPLQEDFDEFSDVDELYSSLPLDKVESLEDLVTIGPPGITKVFAANKYRNSCSHILIYM